MLTIITNKALDRLIEGLILFIGACLPLYLLKIKLGWLPINFLEILVGFLFILWLIWLFQNKYFLKIRETLNQKETRSWLGPILIIFLGATLSTLYSIDLNLSAGIWRSWFLSPLVFFTILTTFFQKKEQINRLILNLFLSGLVVSLISLLYWLRGNLTFDHRLSSFYLSPNHLAMYLAPLFILSFYLYTVFLKKSFKIFLGLGQLLYLVVIYLSHSYGAWLALGTVFLGGLTLFRPKLKYFKRGALMLFLVFNFFVFSQYFSQKFQDILNSPRSSWQSRLMVWQSGWQILKDNWFLGIGPGLFQEYYLAYQPFFEPYLEWAVPQPHNLWLAFWLQTGFLGLLGFIWLIGLFFKKNILAYFLNKDVLFLFLTATMTYILIHGLIDTTYWKNDLAFLFWLVVGLSLSTIKKQP